MRVAVLERIARTSPAWKTVASKHGVENPVPPWKTSLDGTCDALDRCDEVLPPQERRVEEDDLSASLYADVPYPERQLLALAHSLVARGVISEAELDRRLGAVRARLEAA